MKLKEYNAIVELSHRVGHARRRADEILRTKGTIKTYILEVIEKYEEKVKELKNTIPTVPAIYSFGSRSYHEHIYKVGKKYFNSCGMKLGKDTFVKELEEITDEMRESDLADSYYY